LAGCERLRSVVGPTTISMAAFGWRCPLGCHVEGGGEGEGSESVKSPLRHPDLPVVCDGRLQTCRRTHVLNPGAGRARGQKFPSLASLLPAVIPSASARETQVNTRAPGEPADLDRPAGDGTRWKGQRP
jgi:hypothetical protein